HADRVWAGGAGLACGRGRRLRLPREAVPRPGRRSGDRVGTGPVRGARGRAGRGGLALRGARGAQVDRACEGPADGEGEAEGGRRVRTARQGEPGLRAPVARDCGGGHRYIRGFVTSTLTPPKERTRRGTGSGTGDAWRVIVLNDNHNTFEGVAFALAQTIPGVDYDRGMQLANRIHTTRQAVGWSGRRAG